VKDQVLAGPVARLDEKNPFRPADVDIGPLRYGFGCGLPAFALDQKCPDRLLGRAVGRAARGRLQERFHRAGGQQLRPQLLEQRPCRVHVSRDHPAVHSHDAPDCVRVRVRNRAKGRLERVRSVR
jgi:hypothetical protein